MLKNFFILPFIYITAIFLEVINFEKKSKIRIIINNLFYALFISISYGCLVGGFFSLIFINGIDSIWSVIISTIIFILIINLVIILKYSDERIILPNQYIILFSLIIFIINEKYILKSILKLLGLTIILSFMIVNIFPVLKVNLDKPVPLIIGIIITFLLAISILYRVKINSFKQAVNQFLLVFNLVIIVFTIGTLRLSNYTEFNSVTTLLDIILIGFSILGFIFVALPHATDVYERFKNEFNKAYQMFWIELVNISGYDNLKKDVNVEFSNLLDGLISIVEDWKKGNKKEIIKRFLISVPLVLIFLILMYLLVKYGDNLRELIQISIGNLYDKWSSMFEDESKAQLTLIVGSCILAFIYFSYKLFVTIKNKHLTSTIILHINRLLLIICLFIPLIFNLFNLEFNTFIITMLLGLFISIIVLIKIQNSFKRKGK